MCGFDMMVPNIFMMIFIIGVIIAIPYSIILVFTSVFDVLFNNHTSK